MIRLAIELCSALRRSMVAPETALRRNLYVAALAIWMSAGAPSAQSGGSATPDACTIVSRDELVKAVGRSDFGRPRPDTGPNGGSSCRYSSSRGSVTISLASQTRAAFDDFKKLLVDQGKKPETVAGIGDTAYFWDDNSLYALSGKTSFRVFISTLPGADPAKTRADIMAVARTVVAKLKG
jgi:hypothetical protein